jgi:hypothetical protein
MSRRVVLLAAGAVAAAGIGATAVLGQDGDEQDGSAVRGGGRTVAVTRQTLVERETVQGTLGYADTRTVLNRLAAEGSGSGGAAPGGTEPSSNATASAPDAAMAIPAAYFAPVSGEPNDYSPPPDGSAPDDPARDDRSREDPSSNDPSGDDPSGDDPSGDGPSGDDPSGDDDPSRNDPSGDDPSGDDPSGDDPSGDDEPSRDDPSRDDPSRDDPSRDDSSPEGSSPDGASPDADAAADSSSAASGSGTLTALPRPGSVVRRGGALYRVDGEPVVLMYGSTPAYRDLALGAEDGHDVRQLERNLAVLGFDPGLVDDVFTSTSAAAVADWQESAGLPETGAVELGRVVFLPGARRVGEHRTTVGSVLAAGSEVLDASSTRRVVTIELDAALQSLARKGDGVEVLLPDQSSVRGRIAAVGRVAREKEASGSDAAAPDAEQELVIDVTVRLRSPRGLGRLDEAPVSVGLAQESRRNVLAVPVNALVARRGGGYGVELAAGRRIVPVRTGLFAGGYVEVAGSGIREGTRVVVPDA